MSLKKILYIVIILAIIIICLSVVYYLIIYIPDRDNRNINLQQQEKNEKQFNQFREECVAEKEKAQKQLEEIINSCETQECINNIQNGSLKDVTPGADYITDCITRKQNEINLLK